MKNIIIILLFAILTPMTMSAQTSVNKFFNKHSGSKNAIAVDISGVLIKVAAKIAAEEHEAAKILASINRLQVLVLEDENPVSADEMFNFTKKLRNDDFEDLMMVREGKTRVNFFIREKNDKIMNLLILVSEEDNFVMLNLKGKIKFSDLNKLNFDVEGSEHFKKIPKYKKDVPRA